MPEEQYSMGSKVFHAIREDILNGRYEAHEELKEKAIGDELGVSRTPVREALRQLELEGLVHIIPNRGAFVEGVSLKDLKEIYEIRTLLEGLCARWAAEKIKKEQLDALEETIFLTEFHCSKGNLDQMVEQDNRFHQILYEACDSKELTHVLKDYHHYLQRIRKVSLVDESRAKASALEHKRITEALGAHDPDAAEHCAREHIRNTISNMNRIGWENLWK